MLDDDKFGLQNFTMQLLFGESPFFHMILKKQKQAPS